MTDIRTPETDPDKSVPYFYPPFLPNRIFHAATYGGHSSGAIDMNRRSASGAWMQDLGEPVLAAQDGRVVEVDKADGLVVLGHGDGWRTAYRHMRAIRVEVGDRVQRGDQLGEVGNKAGSGSSFGPHLHWVVTRNGKPVQTRFEGKPVATSVLDSDSKPPTWTPPAPVVVTGPPPRATWEGAYREAAKRLAKAEDRLRDQRDQTRLALEERDTARADVTRLTARVAELEAAQPDCSAIALERDAAIRDRDAAMDRLNEETDRAVAAEELVRRVRELVTV